MLPGAPAKLGAHTSSSCLNPVACVDVSATVQLHAATGRWSSLSASPHFAPDPPPPFIPTSLPFLARGETAAVVFWQSFSRLSFPLGFFHLSLS